MYQFIVERRNKLKINFSKKEKNNNNNQHTKCGNGTNDHKTIYYKMKIKEKAILSWPYIYQTLLFLSLEAHFANDTLAYI